MDAAASVYIQPRLEIRQSRVVNSSPTNVRSAQAFDFVMPITRDSGSQNTLKPQAMPMQRCEHQALPACSQGFQGCNPPRYQWLPHRNCDCLRTGANRIVGDRLTPPSCEVTNGRSPIDVAG